MGTILSAITTELAEGKEAGAGGGIGGGRHVFIEGRLRKLGMLESSVVVKQWRTVC